METIARRSGTHSSAGGARGNPLHSAQLGSHLLEPNLTIECVWVVDYVYWKLCGLFMDLTLFSVLLAI